MTATTETKALRSHRPVVARRVAIAGLIISAFFLWPRVAEFAPLRTSPGPPGWRLFREPRHAWTVQYPAGWTAQRIKETHRSGRHFAASHGIFVTNLDRPLPRANRIPPPEFDLRSAGSDFVAVRVAFQIGGPWAVHCPHRTDQLQLSLDEAQRRALPDTSLTELSLSFAEMYWVTAWIGTDVSDDDKRRLDRIVASIRWEQSGRPEGYGSDCYVPS